MTRAEAVLTFIEKLPIRSRDLDMRPLVLNEAQRTIWSKFEDRINRREKIWAIILKARREGVSTLCEALLLHRICAENQVHSLVMASNSENTKEVWRMASTMVDNSPLKKYVSKLNKELHCKASKMIVATAGTPDATRAFDVTCAHLSEVAFWPNKETMLAVKQCIPDHINSYCFIESTANGKVGQGELFYDEWCAAEKGDSEFLPIFLPWFAMREYRRPNWIYADEWTPACDAQATANGLPKPLVLTDLDDEERLLRKEFSLDAEQLSWRRYAIANRCQGSLDLFNQEYPATADAAFVQSGNPMFRTADLLPFHRDVTKGKRYRIEGSRFVEDPQAYVEVWKEPIPGHEYVIGADTSMGYDEGTGRDTRSRSAAQIIDMSTIEQVAEYDASTPPHVQARHLAAMGARYNNALLAPEVTASGGGGGRELIVYLKELNYWNLHIWRHADHIRRSQGTMYGWETNARTRPMMIARIREVIVERSCILHSQKLLKQLANFGENEAGRTEALSGHDDLLFAFGIALCSRRENYFPKAAQDVTVKNNFDPGAYGFGCQEYSPEEAAAAHFRKIRQRPKYGGPQTYLEM